MMLILASISVIVFIVIHLIGYRLKFLDVIPRSVWLSIASGVSVSYILMHLLPSLAEGQRIIESSGIINFGERHVYVIVLIGFILFYGLEKAAKIHKEKPEKLPLTRNGLFRLHMIFFSLYNLIIGYTILNLKVQTYQNISLFALAISLHFFIYDFSLQKSHKELYKKTGRYILSLAILAGFLVSIFLKLPPHVIIILLAFISGAAIINVIKEELPEERKSRFTAFLGGAVLYALLLLAFD